MICQTCGAVVDDGGVFPGALVTCACGAKSKVPVSVEHAPSQGVYRGASTPSTQATPRDAGVRGVATRASCPRCETAMHAETDRAALVCAQCGGSFVDHDELARLIDVARGEVADGAFATAPPATRASRETAVRYLACARCAKPMNRMNFGRRSGVVVDACKAHGTWFDAGELDGALAFVRRGGLEGERPTDVRDVPGHAPTAHGTARAPEDDVARTTREAEALMRFEAVSEQRAIARGVDVVDDLVWLLFGTGTGRYWR